jgi:radical SAM superfamily enzyme YgiQ (UPF0313 family)
MTTHAPIHPAEQSTNPTQPVHPRGYRARVLLTSVFGPYARDDAYGSRALNPMELYHNQVTRVQGPFSLRMFHRSWGIMLIQANISAASTLLDFPKRDTFVRELATQAYDIVGISSIIPNVEKVREMCALVRIHQPGATIVVGGHVANMPDLNARIDADHIVRGEGVRWMRAFLGEDVNQPIRHPRIVSGIGGRIMGTRLSSKPGETAAALIPSVGCPMGCNFCSTSAMFGGKGRCVHFFESGDELFEVMCGLERDLRVRSFFVMDENFLMHRKRALRLLELIRTHGKSWTLYVFSSANVLRQYTLEQLIDLGISWVWMGLEGANADYAKLRDSDTHALVRTLQAHGICVLGSSIIGLEEHDPDNIDAAIDYAVSHNTDFHQFMLYTPLPGTPLHAQHRSAGDLLGPDEFPEADAHGQYAFNYRHARIPRGQETEFLLRAFQRDYLENGPSFFRLARTMLMGWQRHKHDARRAVRDRITWETRGLATTYAGALWAARRWFRENLALSRKISELLREFYREFGLRSRLAAPLIGRFVHAMMVREDRRLRRGWTYEPPTFRETQPALQSIPSTPLS